VQVRVDVRPVPESGGQLREEGGRAVAVSRGRRPVCDVYSCSPLHYKIRQHYELSVVF
jgi:hypothetical protein